MPLTLPDGVIAVPVSDASLLTGPRHTEFWVDVLNDREEVLGQLDGVEPGGSLSWSATASIKGSGSITVRDVGQEVDWLSVRLRPAVRITGPNGDTTESPLGVFIPAAPSEDWTPLGLSRSVELLDKCCLLDQDALGDSVTGTAPNFSLAAGTNVIAAVRSIIEGTGEPTPAILPDTKTLAGPMTWPSGTTRLKVVNELLDAANYFSLWCDEAGQFRCTPYSAPQYRPPRFMELRGFEAGPSSVMAPDFTLDRDYYSVPNRVIALGQGDGEAPGLIATAENTNPSSPFSYQSRGRWIVKTYEGVEAVDQAALDAYAARMLAAASSVTGTAKIKHLLLPGLRVNDVLQFTHPSLTSRCVVTSTTVELSETALCSSDLTEISGG